jgi:hypothetical protein
MDGVIKEVAAFNVPETLIASLICMAVESDDDISLVTSVAAVVVPDSVAEAIVGEFVLTNVPVPVPVYSVDDKL